MLNDAESDLNTMIWHKGSVKWIKADDNQNLNLTNPSSNENEESYVRRVPYLPPEAPKRDDDSVIVGIVLFIIQMSLFFYTYRVIFDSDLSKFIDLPSEDKTLTGLISLTFHVLIAIWVYNITVRKKFKNVFLWVVFSLLFPAISLIISGSMNKRD